MALFKNNAQNLSPEKAGAAQFAHGLGEVTYYLEVEGKLAGAFYRMEGGEIEINIITHDVTYETGDSASLFIPGQTNFRPITLSRGMVTDELSLYNWLAEASSGDIVQARRNGTIWMYDAVRNSSGEAVWDVVAQWNFTNAWLSKIGGFKFDHHLSPPNLAKLTVTIVPEFTERVK